MTGIGDPLFLTWVVLLVAAGANTVVWVSPPSPRVLSSVIIFVVAGFLIAIWS